MLQVLEAEGCMLQRGPGLIEIVQFRDGEGGYPHGHQGSHPPPPGVQPGLAFQGQKLQGQGGT